MALRLAGLLQPTGKRPAGSGGPERIREPRTGMVVDLLDAFEVLVSVPLHLQEDGAAPHPIGCIRCRLSAGGLQQRGDSHARTPAPDGSRMHLATVTSASACGAARRGSTVRRPRPRSRATRSSTPPPTCPR